MLRQRLQERYSFASIIGSAPPMQEIFKIVAQVAASKASILITGESGTGKELIAAAIHERSPRAKGPFVKLHCAALAESLQMERELRSELGDTDVDALWRVLTWFNERHGEDSASARARPVWST